MLSLRRLMIAIVCASVCCVASSRVIYKSPGQLNIGLIVEECSDNLTLTKKTIMHLGIWTVQRLNDLKFPPEHELGIHIYQVCNEEEYLRSIFEMWQENGELLGIIIDNRSNAPKVVNNFCDVLKIPLVIGHAYHEEMIAGSVKVLEAMGWIDNIEVVAPQLNILKEFYRITRRDWMCVNRFHMHNTFIYDENETNSTSSHPIVFLGNSKEIADNLEKISNNHTTDSNKFLIVPFDGETIPNLKDDMLVTQPLRVHPDEPIELVKVLPSTLLFEIAAPILHLTSQVKHCSNISCNATIHREELEDKRQLSIKEILDQLRLESLKSEFSFNIIYKHNETLFSYSAFDEILTLESNEDMNGKPISEIKKRNISTTGCFQHFDRCLLECENFKSFEVTSYFSYNFPYAINLRPEPWVYAFISLSLLGILFCLSIMTFIITRLCKKQILEGNPILTILLLIDVIIMFASVGLFAVEGNKGTRYEIYVLRSLCMTLPYTFAFALLLSRTILLATVSKEVGFMSHVAGTVQGFLTLFIFAVQCALSLQLTNNCQGTSLLSLMSYNAVLLILLVFITPMIAKTKRNYREGKYFTIAIVLLACTWSCWLPAYGVLDEAWKDPLLCLGLVSTGSILLGSIFIPRTYLMTVSAARERFTSALPSLATATSAMDIYRASTQPVYDCVNVAAIAAANLRAQHEQERRHRPDFYAAPQDNDIADGEDIDDEEDEFVVQTCDSPPIDKVTRF